MEVIELINVTRILPNPYQARTFFSQETIQDLARTMESTGLLNPIILRNHPNKEGWYQLAAGERRLRAAKHLGWETIPARVLPLNYAEVADITIVENLQRDSLAPISEADAYKILNDRFNYPHSYIAHRVGKSRPTITNKLRLLDLDPFVKACVRCRTLTAGHASEISRLPEEILPYRVADLAMDWEMTVQELRRLVNDILNGNPWLTWERHVSEEGVEDTLFTITETMTKADTIQGLIEAGQTEPVDILITGEILHGKEVVRTARMAGLDTLWVRIYFSVDWLKKGLQTQLAPTSESTPPPNKALFPAIKPEMRERIRVLNETLLAMVPTESKTQ